MQSPMIWQEWRLIPDCVSVSNASNGSRSQPMTSFRIACRHLMAKRVLLRISFLTLTLLALVVAAPTVFAADETEGAATAPPSTSETAALKGNPLAGPDDVQTLEEDFQEEKADLFDQNLLEQWGAWKADIAKRTGFNFGGDYTAVWLAATSSPGDDKAASGIARVYGSWELLNRGTKNTGSFVYKIEHRHRYTDVTPQLFGFEVGYAGTPEPVFNNDGFRTTELYWKQYFLKDRAVARLGFVDIKQYYDVYALASPWTGFHNLAFSTSSNTQAVFPDGAFGAMVGGYLTDKIYAIAGIADASANPTAVFEGFNTFFNDFDTFKTFEIGITGGGKRLFLDNAHIALWHLDESQETGAQGGHGVNVSMSKLVKGKWLPFLRGGWAHEGGGAYEASVSAGFGYMNQPGGNLLGVGLNWGRPNSDTFPIDLDDQWTGEIFYRVQLLENFQITPSVQFLKDPALYETIKALQGEPDKDKDLIVLFGLRARFQF